MKEKLMWLASIYMIPILFAIVFAFTKQAEINGNSADYLSLAVIGFLFGVTVEGGLMILAATWLVLIGKMKDNI